jgi:signal transduction histidine kinase
MSGKTMRMAIVFGVLAVTVSIHYLLPHAGFFHALHLIHRRLCYIPVILGALWFGLWGGLLTAVAISLAVLPLVFGMECSLWENPEVVEIVFYLGIGTLMGFIVTQGERQRQHKESLMLELAASERFAAAGRTAAGIAHEVRTPLGSIQGATEILAEDYPDGHPRRPFFDILNREIRRLTRVMEDFLDLYRPLKLSPVAADLAEVIRETLGVLGARADARGVHLDNRVAGSLPARFDPDRLRQALLNLVQNAIQASTAGGRVSIEACRTPAHLQIVVEDAGPGIPPENLERIFEPFFSRRQDGTGLGLTLARQIAESHSGSITVESSPGQGARFILQLPAPPA